MIVLSIALGLLAGMLLLPAVSDLMSVVHISLRRHGRRPSDVPELPRLLVLVPAHDEELLLPACLRSLARLRYPADRLDVVVVADNCADGTADIARAAGVQCLVRTAPHEPGKPRAISWALARVPVSQYDGMVVVDADTEVDADFAARLGATTPLAHKALQPYNGVSNRAENSLTRLGALLSEANHGLAYVLKSRAGLNVPLSAGMCIGSTLIGAEGWTAQSLCEDWELYALLTERGVRIEGVPSARIYAQEAATLKASGSQRRRWTAGKLTVLVRHAWPLIRSRHTGLLQKLDALAELSTPGPVVHLCLVGAAIAATALAHPPGTPWLLGALLFTLLRPAVYTIAALCRDPEPAEAIWAFLFLPIYAAWRSWVTATAIGMLGDKPWIRTARSKTRDLRS